MTLSDVTINKIIRKLMSGEDYRAEIIAIIDAKFLEYITDFFKRVVDAKLKNGFVTIDWYKAELLNSRLPTAEILAHAGLNRKTVENMYNSGRREIVLKASIEHHEALLNLIEDLTQKSEVDVTLTIKFGAVSVELNINESLIVINSLAVKRATLTGGLWSTAGKSVEKPLMETLCVLYQVPWKYFDQSSVQDSITDREVDFYLLNVVGSTYPCEIKLMGKGNPESADAAFARDSGVLVADKLSDQNKRHLNQKGIHWVEMRAQEGYKRFEKVLESLEIPFQPFEGDVQKSLDEILPVIIPHGAQCLTMSYTNSP